MKRDVSHTWLIQRAEHSFLFFLTTLNHLRLGVRAQRMVLLPDSITSGSLCAHQALPDDLVLVALDHVKQGVGLYGSRAPCHEHIVSFRSFVCRCLSQAHVDFRNLHGKRPGNRAHLEGWGR